MDPNIYEKVHTLSMKKNDIFENTLEEEALSKHMGLVKSIATRFLGRGVDFDDLVQLGSIGLIKAIRNFDQSTENAFSTYAVPMIMGEMRRYFRDNGPVKISRKIQNDWRTVRKFMQEFELNNQREPRINEIVQGTGLGYDEVILALNATASTVSLTPDEDGSVIEIRDDQSSANFNKIELFDILSKLPKDEKKLIYLRYIKGLTQNQAGEILNLNQVKISRMEKKIKEKLKKELDYQ